MRSKKMMMFVLMIMGGFLLSSCFKSGGRLFIITGDDGISDRRADLIVEALKNKDKDELKLMFSQKALADADDIDDGIEYVVDFFQGTVISIEGDSSVFESIQSGKERKRFKGMYRVQTDADEYLLYFDYTTVNDFNPEEVGLYMLQVIRTEGTTGYLNLIGRSDDLCAGVYQPKD